MGVLVCAGIAAPAASAETPCSETPCEASFRIGGRAVHFKTPERFFPSEQSFTVRLQTQAGALRAIQRLRGCETRYAGPGVRAHVHACNEGAPLRITVYRTWGGTMTMDLTYRAHSKRVPQGVKGISGGSGGTGSASPGRGGIGPT